MYTTWKLHFLWRGGGIKNFPPVWFPLDSSFVISNVVSSHSGLIVRLSVRVVQCVLLFSHNIQINKAILCRIAKILQINELLLTSIVQKNVFRFKNRDALTYRFHRWRRIVCEVYRDITVHHHPSLLFHRGRTTRERNHRREPHRKPNNGMFTKATGSYTNTHGYDERCLLVITSGPEQNRKSHFTTITTIQKYLQNKT